MFWTIFWPVLAAGIVTFIITESFRFSVITWQARKHNNKVKEFEENMKAQLVARGVDPSQIEFMEMFGSNPPPGFFNMDMPVPVSGGRSISSEGEDRSRGGYL